MKPCTFEVRISRLGFFFFFFALKPRVLSLPRVLSSISLGFLGGIASQQAIYTFSLW